MPDLRVRTVGTRVCEEEYQALEKLASARGQTLSEWTRQLVLAQLNPTIASSTEETVIAEVLALRTILLNALFRIAQGEKLTAEEMQKLIERADAGKTEKAREKLAGKAAVGNGAR
jgi:hypothetical protein